MIFILLFFFLFQSYWKIFLFLLPFLFLSCSLLGVRTMTSSGFFIHIIIEFLTGKHINSLVTTLQILSLGAYQKWTKCLHSKIYQGNLALEFNWKFWFVIFFIYYLDFPHKMGSLECNVWAYYGEFRFLKWVVGFFMLSELHFICQKVTLVNVFSGVQSINVAIQVQPKPFL